MGNRGLQYHKKSFNVFMGKDSEAEKCAFCKNDKCSDCFKYNNFIQRGFGIFPCAKKTRLSEN